MIPRGIIETDLEVTEDIEVSRTYKVSDNRIQGFTDELQALKQAIYKELRTERYEYPIYSFNYGIDFESLIGKDVIYVKSELRRRIEECILKDERVISVENFNYETKGDEMLCTLDVISIYGELDISLEVNV